VSLLPLQGGLDVLQRHFTDERLPTSVRGKALDLVTDLANHGLPQPMVRTTQSYLRAVMFFLVLAFREAMGSTALT